MAICIVALFLPIGKIINYFYPCMDNPVYKHQFNSLPCIGEYSIRAALVIIGIFTFIFDCSTKSYHVLAKE